MTIPKFLPKLFEVILVIVFLAGCAAPTATSTLTATLAQITTPVGTQIILPTPATSTLTATPAQITTPVGPQINLSTPATLEFVWKITGDPHPFNYPVGVSVDPQGNVYVMDVRNSRVQKFDSNGKFLLMWGTPGSGDGQFNITLPDEGRLAADTLGNIYVLDVNNYRVEKFDSNGNFLTKWGTEGNADGQFAEASDIAIDKQNDVYVVDFRNYTVQKFDENGKFLLRWGSRGGKDGEFAGVYSVAIDPNGNVLVADESGRIQMFGSDGKFLSNIPLKPLDNRFIDTWNIAADIQSNISVADHNGKRIVKLNSQGKVLSAWIGSDVGAAIFTGLQDIAVDQQGNIYVSDSTSNIVQKFRQPSFHP